MDLAFKALINFVSRESGIDLTKYREGYLRRRIELRMKMLNIKDFGEYLRYMRNSNDSEVEKLVNTITINVTEFMRDRTPFQFFMEHIIPDIAARKRKVKSNFVRFWSAGCSCGEEPYSIAICALEALGEGWMITVYATDIDDACLEAAKEGFYRENQLKNLSKNMILRYFEREDDGYRVKTFLRRMVRFKKHDLTTEDPVSKYLDAVFCRNVMIYFTEEQKTKVVQDFYDSLVTGGYLIIGKSETLPAGFKDKFDCINLKEKVYRKT